MRLLKTIFILVFVTLIFHTSFCQVYPTDSALVNSKISDTYNLYKNTIGGSSLLYNGAEYVNVYHGVHGSPFFESNDFEIGFISYNGIAYNYIPLKYNLVTNDLIIKGFQDESISLVKEKIDSFYVLKHHFVKLVYDSSNLNASPQQFYDLLYDGENIKFLVKREKAIKQAFRAEDPSSFITYTTYYIVKENAFLVVSNKKTLMNALGGKSDVMKSFWKNNKIDFKKNAENSIRTAVEYYDQLKK